MTTHNNLVRQWVSNVISYSSQYNDSTWAANKVVGPPQAYPNYGDLHNTWAQSTHRNNEFIELEFPQELVVTKLNIYETYHAGAVVCIKFKNKNNWITVWETNRPENIEHSRIFSPNLRRTNFATKIIRLELDCTVANTWCEIDAVEMEGKKPLDPLECENDLANDLKKLLNSNEYCDVQFEIEGKIIDAHRNVLVARSNYFKGILCENLKPNRLSKPIHIENTKYDTFKALLHYLYTNKIEDNTKPEIVCELMRISDWYNIENLKSVSYSYIQEILSIDNVLDIYNCSSSIEPILHEIADVCLNFMIKHFHSLVHKQELNNLPQPVLLKLTQLYAKNRK